MRLVLRSVVLFLVVLLGLVGSSSSLLSQVVSSNATVKEVEFAAEDNVLLKGTYGVPENGQAKHPAIIFVHERGGDRKQWASFMGVFYQQGYAVLAYDVRGQGESTSNYRVPQDDLQYRLDLVKDIGGALKFLMAQSEIDPQRIGIAGIGFSANTVWASMGIYPELKAAVAVSIRFSHLQPVYPFKFAPRRVLFMTDPIDKNGAQFFAEQTDDPKQVNVYIAELNFDYGMELLQEARATQDMFAWFKRFLLSF